MGRRGKEGALKAKKEALFRKTGNFPISQKRAEGAGNRIRTGLTAYPAEWDGRGRGRPGPEWPDLLR